MRVLVTGSAGHLGEALMRTLGAAGHDGIGLDIKASPFTHHVGSIADRGFVDVCMRDVEGVVHAATLHKPHIETHSRQQFVDTNITGTLNLLEAAVARGAKSFVFTSTTSTLGHALKFDRMIVSATTPFERDAMARLRQDASAEVYRLYPDWRSEYAKRGWHLPRTVDRVYVNERARARLGWEPEYGFESVVRRLRDGDDYRSALARAVGKKLYHAKAFADGPYPGLSAVASATRASDRRSARRRLARACRSSRALRSPAPRVARRA